MWQSRVQIVGYSVAYFDRIAVFEAHHSAELPSGGAHTCFVIIDYLRSTYDPRRSSAIQHFKHSDALEIHDGITFDFWDKNTSARLCTKNAGEGGRICGTLRFISIFHTL